MGEAGERFAAWWLSQQGLTVLGRNVKVDGGEVDLVARDGTMKVVVEVRTRTGAGDPIDAVDSAKRDHVLHLASKLRASRVDFVGVGLRPWGVEVHWLPG